MTESFEQMMAKRQARIQYRNEVREHATREIVESFEKRVADSDSIPKGNWGQSNNPLEAVNPKNKL